MSLCLKVQKWTQTDSKATFFGLTCEVLPKYKYDFFTPCNGTDFARLKDIVHFVFMVVYKEAQNLTLRSLPMDGLYVISVWIFVFNGG